MKVTVNITSIPQDELVDVAQSYVLTAPDAESRNIYINLGQFANGTTTEVDDIVVTQFGCEAADVVVGEPLTTNTSSSKKTNPVADPTPVVEATSIPAEDVNA